MSTTASANFVTAFFNASGTHPNAVESQRHFDNAFVEPLGFEDLVTELKPESGYRKIVIVDGHPRSGKSWCVLQALRQIIDKEEMKPEQLWTAGLDSMAAFRDRESNLYTGAETVLSNLKKFDSLKLVLLDDFFGTNKPRELGASLLDQRVLPFLTWDNDNPWLREMPEGSTFVLTGRALHITLVEILLGVNIRRGSSKAANIKVINPRRGLFRTFARGDMFGAFDEERLAQACAKNIAYHPLPHNTPDEQNWLVMAAPILAFGHTEGIQLTSQIKTSAAHILFGEDLESLASLLKRAARHNPSPDVSDQARSVLHRLYESYLVAIAPGLLFLDDSAYRSLGIGEQNAIDRIAIRGLYLYESQASFSSGRLPNEFYMTAVNDHLGDYLDLAAAAFANVAPPNTLSQPQRTLGLGLRGLLERGLYKKSAGAFELLRSAMEFNQLLDEYQSAHLDILLTLENGQFSLADDHPSALSSGLAAAMGWALVRFSKQLGPTIVHDVIMSWFPQKFRGLAMQQAKISWINYAKVNDLVAAFSVFLQWTLELHRDSTCSDLDARLDRYLDMFLSLVGEFPAIRDKLMTVMEDELFWASIEELCDAEVMEERLKLLSDGKPGDCLSESVTYCVANRFFTRVWHNEWMERETLSVFPNAESWKERYGSQSLDLIRKNPEILADNLQYHWCHFLTQRAAWMRDWVFHDDPYQFELNYSKVAPGSGNPDHNSDLVEIAIAVLSSAKSSAESIRNIVLLIGTRARRINRLPEITAKIDELLASKDRGVEISAAVVQAICELSRQGFLELWSDNITDAFRQWCEVKMTIFDSLAIVDHAWLAYYAELENATHLDLLPEAKDGWRNVLPKEWGFNKLRLEV